MRYIIAALFIATPATAQQTCFPYDAFQEGIASKDMALSFSGMTGDQLGLLQIYTHADGRWVVAQVTLNGVACLLSGGEQSRVFVTEPEGEDS